MRHRVAHRAVGVGVAAATLLSAWLAGACGAPESEPPAPVILVGIDAFGWDFRGRAATPHLDELAARGVVAERLIPVFPTKTFPNHYTIVTGLYAEHHGIVANNMYDPERDAWFRLGDRDAVTDPAWWGGEPIWVTAERQGLTTAAFFWPGAEAPIQGVHPTHWRPYDGSVPNTDRVRQVLEWLDLPAERRPSFITLYFSHVDDAAHRYAQDSEEVRAAIREADALIGLLITGLEARGLRDNVNVIVTSDHGMAPTSSERVILVDDYLNLDQVQVVDWNPVLAIRPLGNEQAVYQALAGAHPHLSVYRKADIPARYHYRDNPRIMPILGGADEGWSISSRAYVARNPDRHDGGNHGYDHLAPTMGGTFLAAGPAFKEGLVVPPFQNIHIYELLCAVLGLDPAPNDGDRDSVRVMLR